MLRTAAVRLAGSVELGDGLVQVGVDLLVHLTLGGTVQVVGFFSGQPEDDGGLVLPVGPAPAVNLGEVEIRIGAVGQRLGLDVGPVTVGAFRGVDVLEDGVGIADEGVIVVPGKAVQVRSIIDEPCTDGVVLEGRRVALHQVVSEIIAVVEPDGSFSVVSLAIGAVLTVHDLSESVDGHGRLPGRFEDRGRRGIAGRRSIQIVFRAAERGEKEVVFAVCDHLT